MITTYLRMSGDDTIGVVKSNGIYYVNWFIGQNYDSVIETGKQFNDYGDALKYAHELDRKNHTEYGVQVYDD
jgi:hypothetical protein